jgi:radical SAM superfamily enzyme YgiQ (UPF0313 family)
MLCEKSGKFMYDTKPMAESVLSRKHKIRKTHIRDGRRFNAKMDVKHACTYKCQFCGKYHIAGVKKY